MILDTTSKTIQVILGAAKTTNNCEITADYVDTQGGSTFVPGNNVIASNGTSSVTAVPSPAASTQRAVRSFTFYNADTVNTTVTVRLFDGTNTWRINIVTLTPGQSLIFTPEGGWNVLSAGGIVSARASIYTEVDLIPNASGVPLTTATVANVLSLNLSPGEFDILGSFAVSSNSGASTLTRCISWLSTTSATLPSKPNNGAFLDISLNSTNDLQFPVGRLRVVSAAAFTIYLSAYATFTGTTPVFSGGTIQARQIV